METGWKAARGIGAYVELTKPRITWLILMSTAVGYFFGESGPWRFSVLFHALLGTGLLASGTATLNEWYEREGDGRMRRTRDRPIPSGRVAPGRALGFGILLSALGFADLAWGANMVAAFWGLVTLLSYLFLYTPLKRRTPHSTTLGALPGAMPPLIGYAAARGALAPGAWVLFAILFFWQFPHFLAIAWMYREDYRRGGIVFLPVVEPDGKSTARQMLAGALLLVPISLLPAYLSMAGRLYGIGALALGVGFVLVTLRLALDRTAVRARGVLLASVVYLPLLYGLLLADSSRLWPS